MTIPRLFVFVLSAWLLTGCQFPQISPSEPVETSPAQKTTADTQTPSCDWSLPPDNPEGITEQKLAKQTADSLSRQWKNAHAHTGLPCPGREEELSMFFDQLGAWQAGLPEARDPATLLATAEILRSAPCDDPALLHAHGLLLQEAGRYTEAFDLFLQAAARYDQLGASGILKARNAVAIYTVIHQIGDDHDKDQCFRWKDRALEFLAQGVARDTFRPEDLRPLHAHISEHWKKIYWTRDGDQRHTGDELIAAANALPPRTGILVECSAGPMPGGTGNTWDWATAAALAPHHPFALAGGLTAANLPEAVRASQAAGLDVSSSLETAPGIKNPDAIRAFLEAAAALPPPPASFVWKGNS